MASLNKVLPIFCLFFIFNNFAFGLIYRKYFPDHFTTLDPMQAQERYSNHIITQLFDPLFELTDGLTPIPHLAKSFTYNPQTLTYIIALRDDVTFHNGKKMTAEDVIFTFRRMCKESPGMLKILPIIQGCKSPNPFGVRQITPFQVEIRTTEHYPPFIASLASAHFMILPNKLLGKTKDGFFKNPIGTGAFILDNFTKTTISLKRYENYFLGSPDISKLEFYIEPPQKIYERVKNSEIDDIYPLSPPNSYPKNYHKTFVNLASTVFLGFQPSIPPFNKPSVRKAIRAAINNNVIHEKLSSLEGWVPAKGVVPWGAIGFVHDIPVDHYQPSALLPLIKKAGYRSMSEVPEIEIRTVLKEPISPLVPEFVKSELEKAGFKIRMIYQTLPEIMADIKRKKVGAMLINLTMTSVDTYQFLELWRSDYRNLGLIAYNKKIDALLDSALQTSDRMVRAAIYEQVNRLIEENAYTHNIAYVVYQESLHSNSWLIPKIDILGPFFMKMYRVKKSKSQL